MNATPRPVTLSPGDVEKIRQIEQLANTGVAGTSVLIDSLAESSWTVRRGVVAALARQGDSAIGPLCQSLREGRDNETRIAAVVDALVLSKGDVERAVFPMVEHTNAAVVYDVAQILGRRKAGPAVPLLAKLTLHPDDNVAVAAIEALGHIGGNSAVAALITAVNSGNFFRTFPAIDVLGRSGDPDAVGTLLTLLELPVYAPEAIRALGRTGDERAVLPLMRFFGVGGDTLLRPVAVALCEISASQELRSGRGGQVAEVLRAHALPASLARRLLSCFDSASVPERLGLCKVLGWIGGDEAVAGLLDLLTRSPETSRAASKALAEIGSDADRQVMEILRGGKSHQILSVLPFVGRRAAALPDVLLTLSNPEPGVRVAACEALARVGETAAVRALFPLLADPDARVAQAAQAAIQALGSPLTETLTLEAGRSSDPKVRRAALRIIAYFGYPSGLEILLSAAEESDEKLRDAALYGLPFIEDPRAGEVLRSAAVHPSAKTRAAAMRALGQTERNDATLKTLRGGLSDPDGWVRYYTVQSLGKLKDQASVDALMALHNDPAGQVRVAVVDALAMLATPAAVAHLHRAVASADLDVKRAALVGLGVARHPESLRVLLQATEAPESSIRLVAISALAQFEAPEVAPALVRAAQDSDASVRTAAVGYLASRHGTAATRDLVALLEDESLRELLLDSLALPVDGRIAGISQALVTAEEAHAALLIGSLAKMHRADSAAAILEALRKASPPGRKAAAHALATWQTNAAKSALERAAREDPDADVRRICSLALVP